MKYLPAIILKWIGLVFSGLVANAILFGIFNGIGLREGWSMLIALTLTVLAIININKLINKSIERQVAEREETTQSEKHSCKRCKKILSFFEIEHCKDCKNDYKRANELFREHGITPTMIMPQQSKYGVTFGKEVFYKIDWAIYNDLVDHLIKSKFDIDKVAQEFYISIGVQLEKEKKQIRETKQQMREKIEQRVYGKVQKKNRKILSEEEKDMIFNKFNNQCVTCGKTEGLHIHHKDKNPSNNIIENLSVLCGVCHKKVHMKV